MNALVPFLANAFGGSDRLKPFSFVMGHLTVNREVWLIHETLNISSAQILLAMKLTMFEWNVYDGQKLKKDLDQWQFQKRITKYPTLLEFLGYTTIGLTWGGTTYTWGSVNVLIPLVLGLVGLGTFIAYEVTLTKYPLVPFALMTNVTSHDGSADYLQIYLQACKGVSPIASGVYSLSLASYALATIITGISIKATGRYRPQAWIGWVLTVISFGLLSTLLATDPLGKFIAYVIPFDWGMDMTVTLACPIQAPVPVTQNAPALAFMWFLRDFSLFRTHVWGIAVGGTVLQNELAKKLPEPFVGLQGTSIVYALIPELSKLPPQTLSEVQAAFANGLTVLWRVLAALSGVGLLMLLFLRGLPLHNTLDEDWALKNEKADASI
ncbi:hypothetical protein EV363DRAFT_1301762 [Boletus edulis]|nr:hypothetical protein EV363DRAFT_1301762 [Boletus edulis]